MSRAALRISTLGLGVLAFALRILHTFWWQPLSWRIHNVGMWLGFLVAGLLVAALIPFALYVVLFVRAAAHPPATFDVRNSAFVAPPSPANGGAQSIMFMFLAGGLLPTERVPGGDSMRLFSDPFLLPVAALVLAAFLGVAVAFAYLPRPRVRLDPDGLTIDRLLRRRVVLRWTDLAPGGPLPPVPGRKRALKLFRTSAPVAGWTPGEELPAGWLYIDAAFLASAIRHYVEHPESRAAIGTPEELARLQHSWADQAAANAAAA
jgi:hypothetical protein